MIFSKSKKIKPEEKSKNAAQNPKILEVNLIKDEIRISFDWAKNLSILVITLLIVCAFVGEIYFGLDFWSQEEKMKAESLNANINSISSEINKVKAKADEALVYKDKSIALSKLLGEHIYWSNFFSWLEKNTLSTVKFASFSGDASGAYTLSAEALSFAEVSWQVKAFLNDPFVKNVSVSSVSALNQKDKEKNISVDKSTGNEKGVNFSLSFELDPSIFKK